MSDQGENAQAAEVAKANILVEEWKLLAGYVDDGFRSIEAQALQIALLVAAAIGAFKGAGTTLPCYSWLLIAPAVFAMMLRMKSQAAFTFFQAKRITEIEDEINIVLGIKEPHYVFYYAHRVATSSKKLGCGYFYPYPAWTLFVDLLGLTLMAFATLRSMKYLASIEWEWTSWLMGTFFALAGTWYIVATVLILYRFYRAVEGHPKECALRGQTTIAGAPENGQDGAPGGELKAGPPSA